MSKKQPELRMYFLVQYNISPIQQGIQALHACVEYQQKYGNTVEYKTWAKKHKTVILLNGGTSNDGLGFFYGNNQQLGTMEMHLIDLEKNKIKCAAFYEPDLNYCCSAIAFLVPETVYNKKDYPDFEQLDNWDNRYKVHIIKKPLANRDEKEREIWEKNRPKRYNDYVKEFGKDVAFLKDFLKPFRLA